VTVEELVTKYIRGAERVIQEIGEIPEDVHLNEEEAKTVFDWAKRYLEDAKYYQKEGKLETSLTSVAYCEGLLDALRLLGAVEFSW
jgi:FAD synthetase